MVSGQLRDNAVALVAIKLANDKITLSFDHAFFLGILCNVLVCLAVWLSLGARSTSGKILAVIFPVSAFVVAGFEHSVANMYLIPLGLLMKAWLPVAAWAGLSGAAVDYSGLTWSAFFVSLIPVTIGNIVGSGVLVAGVYWFVYLRPATQPTRDDAD